MGWPERQAHCEAWYKSLPDAKELRDIFEDEYRPFSDCLQSISGRVLDVGGGCGFAAGYLPVSSQYLILDPETFWTDPKWKSIVAKPLPFVRGLGEALPFGSAVFDAVISMWSLNHAVEPPQMVVEMARVLKPGGRLLIVLEETEPRWTDWLRRDFREPSVGAALRNIFLRKLIFPCLGKSWPMAADHVDVRETSIVFWLPRGGSLIRRRWIAGYLCLEFKI
jgi:ubiquinone/menaquinone biosynthesis C-methylase UbiE